MITMPLIELHSNRERDYCATYWVLSIWQYNNGIKNTITAPLIELYHDNIKNMITVPLIELRMTLRTQLLHHRLS